MSLVDSAERLHAYSRSSFPLTQTIPFGQTFAFRAGHDISSADLDSAWEGLVPVTRVIRHRETLGGIFAALGVPGPEAKAAVAAASTLIDLRRIQPGSAYTAYFANQQLAGFELELRGEGELGLQRLGDGWSAEIDRYERAAQIRRVSGTLAGGLESAMRTAGADPQLAYRVADVLEWDLDFNRDLQLGDKFEVLYEELSLDGKPAGLGKVLAVSYDNQHRGSWRRIEAYRYADGYYDADGRPTRKLFLRSPLPFSRVTSRFSHRRFHPVLGVHRPHYGVDYGAPVGTPVRVTGGGVVSFVGWDRGGGKTVKVRHGKDYETCYLHLSGYAKGLGAGSRVSQGEVIGYVGATGLATGPHLDYRVRFRGTWIDPLLLGREQAETLEGNELPRFRAARDELRLALSTDSERDGRGLGARADGSLLAAAPVADARAIARR